jgi:activator of HSP90 ATPase
MWEESSLPMVDIQAAPAGSRFNVHIVQTMRASDWPDDHSSILTIILSPVSLKTKLSFVQTGFPMTIKGSQSGWYGY